MKTINCRKCNNAVPQKCLTRDVYKNGAIHFTVHCPFCFSRYNAPQTDENVEIFSCCAMAKSKKLVAEMNEKADLFGKTE